VGTAEAFQDGILRRADREYLDRTSVFPGYDQLDVPAYHAGGWYDIFLNGTLQNFSALMARGRAPQKLLIGPWSHMSQGELIGELSFGFRSSAAFIDGQMDFMSLQLRWFDHWLRDQANGIDTEPPIKLFVMGENVWRYESEWPLRRAVPTAFYLHSAGRANTSRGDGSLSTEVPGDESADRYTYDPRDPVPTIGGATLLHAAYPAGARDQRANERRGDVLVYTSEPLTEDVEVTGPVSVTLWAASSARDTDFVARLVDVFPDGRAITLTDGIIRARARDGLAAPESLIDPGRAYAYEIDLWATSNLFREGHCIRLDVTSSSFPRWDRNHNTGAENGLDDILAIADQVILHDAAHPSRLHLPIVPRG
jgi:uncharacterized protein